MSVRICLFIPYEHPSSKTSDICLFVFYFQLFVSDRKIDEELGSTQRFQCAAEELMRAIRNFGDGEFRLSYKNKLNKKFKKNLKNKKQMNIAKLYTIKLIKHCLYSVKKS